MKTFVLSDPKERRQSLLFTAVMAVVLVAIPVALRGDLTIFLMTAVGCLLLLACLALYVRNVTRAKCIFDPETRQLQVQGLRDYTVDLTNAVRLETVPLKTGQSASRGLLFTDAEGNRVALVPTVFTSRQGLLAEPFAIDMAREMGLEFQANVPVWEYDEEQRVIHEKEVAEQQKRERQERREAKIRLRRQKLTGKKK